MNYLQLCQATLRESGLSGTIDSVATATGVNARICSWVNWAARDITMQREDWRFRRGMATAASTTLQANSAAVFGLTDFAAWKAANKTYAPTAYRVSDGAGTEHKLAWLDYDTFRMKYLIGVQVPGSSQEWSISPTDEILLGPAPDSAHFVRADYARDFVDLVSDLDTPILPAKFHMLIVWRALTEYGGYDAAAEVFQRADRNYSAMWPQLVQSQMEAPGFIAATLA